MLTFRITMAVFGARLIASGNAARWSSKDIKVIYTASSRSLACLENIVHRDQKSLSQHYNVLTIDCPDNLKIKKIELNNLPLNWTNFDNIAFTQAIGDKWVTDNETPIMQVPSSIINEETNYLLNPAHPDFKLIKLVKVQSFAFDERIKS